jgi:hypothetical protein
MQLAAMESQVVRHQTDLDIQLRRIAQLQDEVDALKRAQSATAVSPDALVIALPKPSFES